MWRLLRAPDGPAGGGSSTGAAPGLHLQPVAVGEPVEPITRADLCAAIASLGFDPYDVYSLTMTYEGVDAVLFERCAEGYRRVSRRGEGYLMHHARRGVIGDAPAPPPAWFSECPKCGADPRSYCRTRTGNVLPLERTHVARLDASRATRGDDTCG